MSSFEIDLNFQKDISLSILCLKCEKKFSTELDVNLTNENTPYFNNEMIYCHYCEQPYEYNLKIDSNKLQIDFKEVGIIGSLEYSIKPDVQEYKTFSPTPYRSKQFYYIQIERLKKILDIETNEYITNQSLNRLVFSGVVTSLETYLNEIFLHVVFYSEETLERFVDQYEPYRKEQLPLSQIFPKFRNLKSRIYEDVNNLIYHNINKIIKLFNIFSFELHQFDKIKSIAKHIQTRHNFIHRSGINQDDTFQEVLKEEVLALIDDVNLFVEYTYKKIEKKCFSPEDDSPF